MLFYLWQECQSLQQRGLNYVLSAQVSVQGFSLPLFHTLLPPHKHPGITGSLSNNSPFRGRMCHGSTPQAFHLHPLLPCGLPGRKLLPSTLCWLLCCREAESIVCYRNPNFPGMQPYQQTSHPSLETELKSPLSASEKVRLNSPRAASSGEHKAGSNDCMREKFNGISRSLSGTWPSASLQIILLIKSKLAEQSHYYPACSVGRTSLQHNWMKVHSQFHISCCHACFRRPR